MKKRIYQTPDFEALIKNNGYYVDRTHFIHVLEEFSNPHLFFLRPRRFGKSLLLSMLERYYGIQYKDRFEEFFGEYFIGKPQNLTPLKNSYYILNFSFSGINTEDSTNIEREFNAEVTTKIMLFLEIYNIGLREEREIFNSQMSGTEILRRFFSLFKKYARGGKIYLMIDEYDHFTNDLFSFNQDHFNEIVSRNGWVRKFYEVIKQFVGDGIVDRFFATGVTPVTLDSMTSGFNIATNVTLDNTFHNMAGFTEPELRELIVGTIYEDGKFDIDKLLTDMRAWFNGSRFSKKSNEKLYNPQLVLNFLSNFKNSWQYPDEITDNNVTSDWKKISNILIKLPKKERDSIIEEVYINEGIKSGLSTQFNLEMPYTVTDAISILFYNGLLTIDEEKYGIVNLVIPNYVIKNIYWEYLRSRYELEYKLSFNLKDMSDIFVEMASEGKIKLLVKEISRIMKPLRDHDFQNFRESNLKMIVISILSLNKMFIINSEMPISEGRIDLLLTKYDPYDSKYQFLLEFKYLKISDNSKYEEKKSEAIKQLLRYKSSDEIKRMENLKSYLIIFHNKVAGEIIEV